MRVDYRTKCSRAVAALVADVALRLQRCIDIAAASGNCLYSFLNKNSLIANTSTCVAQSRFAFLYRAFAT